MAGSPDAEEDGKQVIRFITFRIWRQNTLLKSLRQAMIKGGFEQLAPTVRVLCQPFAPIPPESLDAKVKRLVETQLRDRVEDTDGVAGGTTINNTFNTVVILHNFGEEDKSNLQDPVEYLERTYGGLRALLKDVYFNGDQPHNQTVRLNVADKTAEIHRDGDWRPISLPVVSSRMIGECTSYMVRGFNASTHGTNSDVRGFMGKHHLMGTDKELQTDIHQNLVQNSNP